MDPSGSEVEQRLQEVPRAAPTTKTVRFEPLGFNPHGLLVISLPDPEPLYDPQWDFSEFLRIPRIFRRRLALS